MQLSHFAELEEEGEEKTETLTAAMSTPAD